ncbi:nuclear transport factor 2 family protein [Nocardia huaxiensis]|uniref:nuclear transport factor 2 family protein n=1 Tax=Nocardia huaxiensis TaxID=2755382 RepID=UPI001E2D7BF0|nr:nuclear transport factor 2 family protein [Nocardia huaxiensis]UFS93367.1 nuclear transport factor 2 family protein [Nocardia huaxiensis]
MSTTSFTEPAADVERALRARYDAWLVALVANDADAIAGFVTPDWIFAGENGITPGDLFLNLVRDGTLSHSAMDAVSDPIIRVYGETATLTVRVTNTAHYQGQRIESDEWTTDVFVRHDGAWRCALTHLTGVRGV